jgi:hypothetical protein
LTARIHELKFFFSTLAHRPTDAMTLSNCFRLLLATAIVSTAASHAAVPHTWEIKVKAAYRF